MARGSARPEGGAFDDTPKANDWYTSGPDCSLYAGADFDGDGLDDLFTFNAGRQLFYSPNVHGWKPAGWQMILENGPENAVALAGGDWIADLPGEEIAIVGPHEVRVVGRPKDGKFDQVVTLAAPDGVTFKGADRTREGQGRLLSSDEKAFIVRDRAIVPEPTASEPRKGTAEKAAEWFFGATIGRATGTAVSEGMEKLVRASAPPYEPDAKAVAMFEFGFARPRVNGEASEIGVVYDCHLPHDHHVIRVVTLGDPAHLDSDADGLTDQQERELGTDPFDRDTDDDSLLDGWEVNGLPRGIDLGPDIPLYSKDRPEAERDKQLNPLRQDVICNVSYFDGVDPKQFANEIPQVQRLYRELNTPNPDGSHGIWVHVRPLPTFVAKADQTLGWWDIGAKYCPKNERGLVHWMQVTPWGGGQAAQTGDMGGCGNGWAVFAHEFGHQMSLGHEGDSAASWCPLYPSLMSYAFSYSFDGDGNKVHFSRGQFPRHRPRRAKSQRETRVPLRRPEVPRQLALPLHAQGQRRRHDHDRLEPQREVRRDPRRGRHQLRRVDQLRRAWERGHHRHRAGAGVCRRRVLPSRRSIRREIMCGCARTRVTTRGTSRAPSPARRPNASRCWWGARTTAS